MKRAVLLLSLPCACLGGTNDVRLSLPQPLSGYRSWQSLMAAATRVSPQLAALCRPMSKRDAEQLAAAASKPVGPHGSWLYVRAYANAIARSSLADPGGTSFPAGSVIAKEKLLGAAVRGRGNRGHDQA